MILGIRGIEESWVYQDIFAEGKAEGAVEEARNALLHLGRKKLGEPDERVLALLAALGDRERLNLLLDALLEARAGMTCSLCFSEAADSRAKTRRNHAIFDQGRQGVSSFL